MNTTHHHCPDKQQVNPQARDLLKFLQLQQQFVLSKLPKTTVATGFHLLTNTLVSLIALIISGFP